VVRIIIGIFLAIIGTVYLMSAVINWANYTIEGMIYSLLWPVAFYVGGGFLIYFGIQARNKAKDLEESRRDSRRNDN
jgi:threonine/homoserine/homoserine lactone efflux protein